ncbi:hypothetical protein EN742_17440 [Mesorhizobium sp. M4A.F.Ca.ET.020.02.1.1]|uniref:hypothetical protein n=1 Tax=unclassified Mesorhizobium TaxID=325217 RepID=UPI000FD2B228|nr:MULTISPECIES: hypothetical protein [unclassified Mesorhizobium]RVD38552.1 hypothetical protein EN742_17440 [Mesorhizobium sp. M4A.F.Ca.ET.020.02.1.1]RWC10911.1 MAG: hypothetical protein EOS53_28265 [Mesorhizobium sp.]
MAKVNPEKDVPSPEDLSANLRDMEARLEKLGAERVSVDEEQRAIAREDAAAKRETDKKEQIDALIRGSSYVPPAATRDKMAALAQRRILLDAAIEELSRQISQERIEASKLVVNEFQAEQQALAAEFFRHLAKAIAVHSRFGHMKQRLERAGVNTAGLRDFGDDLLGTPNSRSDHAAYHLRYGLRFGHLKSADAPEGYL